MDRCVNRILEYAAEKVLRQPSAHRTGISPEEENRMKSEKKPIDFALPLRHFVGILFFFGSP